MAQDDYLNDEGYPVPPEYYTPPDYYGEERGAESPTTQPRDPEEFADAADRDGYNPPQQAPKAVWNDRLVEAWRNSGGNTQQQLQDWANTHWAGMGVQVLPRGNIVSPTGRRFDLIGNFGTDEAQGRTGYTTDQRYSSGAKPNGNWTSGGGGGGSTAPGGGGGVNIGSSTSVGKSAEQTLQDQALHDAIARLLARGETPVTQADVANQYGGVSATMQRGAERAKAEAAERSAFQGTSVGGAGGALDTEHRGIEEDLALGEGELMAKLMGDEIMARRADVVNALGFAQGEQKIKLTEQLALMDDALARLKLQQDESQFARSLKEGARQFDVGEAGQNSRFGQTMDYNYDRFGFDRGVWEYEVNQGLNRDLA